jgi:hypothetical protein
MKHTLLIIVAVMLVVWFYAFGDDKDQSEYDAKLEEELSSSRKVNDIFLTFKFGDSKSEVNNKFSQLKDEGKLYLDENLHYTYRFVFDDYFNIGYVTFSQKYHNDKLYEFRMMVKPHDDMKDFGGSGSADYLQTKSESLLISLATLYMDKYGLPISKDNILFDAEDYFWLNGNREIKLSLSYGFVNILYRDLSTLKSIEEERKEKILDEAKKTKEDI